MFVISKRNTKCVWVLMLISFICLANARQIRYSRNSTEIIEDSQDNKDIGNSDSVNNNQIVDSENEIQATVREVKLAPYPASGNRSMRAYPLPSGVSARAEQTDLDGQVTYETLSDVTTAEAFVFTTTTQEYESETTTISNKVEEKTASSKPKAPYPAAGFKPRVPFLLPTEDLLENAKTEQRKNCDEDLTEQPTDNATEMLNDADIKAPYPAAGYRPSKAFLLPSEQLQLENEEKDKEKVEPKMDNRNHPPCGSSTDPLAPKPLDGEKEDPNSESIFINTQVQTQKRAVIIPVRYSIHPLLITRPLVYSAPTIDAW